MAVIKIISGAQTGADRAGLDVGLACGLQTGGFVPKGRRTEAGPLDVRLMLRYNLIEHTSPSYRPRTELNVQKSDGTVLFGNMDSAGSKLTIKFCLKHKKPHFAVTEHNKHLLAKWLIDNKIQVLNVAGNRASTNYGIYNYTYGILLTVIRDVNAPHCLTCGMEKENPQHLVTCPDDAGAHDYRPEIADVV